MKAWDGEGVASLTTHQSKAGSLVKSEVWATAAEVSGEELGLTGKTGTGGR